MLFVSVYVVEPEGKDLGPCLETGEWAWPGDGGPTYVKTLAEGCHMREVGPAYWPTFSKLVDKRVFTVVSKYRTFNMHNSGRGLWMVATPT